MTIALIIAIIGALVYIISTGLENIPPCIAEIGRISFFVGLLAFLLGK